MPIYRRSVLIAILIFLKIFLPILVSLFLELSFIIVISLFSEILLAVSISIFCRFIGILTCHQYREHPNLYPLSCTEKGKIFSKTLNCDDDGVQHQWWWWGPSSSRLPACLEASLHFHNLHTPL